MGSRRRSSAQASAIFFSLTASRTGILPIVVDKEIVDGLAVEVENTQGAGRIGIDLQEQTITDRLRESDTVSRSIRVGAPDCSKDLMKSH